MDNLPKGAFRSYIDALDPSSGAELSVSEWNAAAAAAVMTRPVLEKEAAGRLASFATGRQVQVLHSGPGQWLVIDLEPTDRWLEDLEAGLGGTAQMFDKSSGFALLRLSGRHARTMLQKGIFVDLDIALQADGMHVNSMIAHIAVTVWRAAPDLFGIAMARSYAGSFWHWFEAAATAEGIRPSRTLQPS